MPDSPFKLFEPYGPEDKDAFFGRNAEVYALYHLLQQTRLVLVYGASGAGKTSLIHAGLPKVFKATDWFRVSIRRRDDINQSLRGELARRWEGEGPSGDLPRMINDIFEERWIPLYLVFDQFEEVFTLGNHPEREAFFRDLQSLLSANLPCKVLLVMREEYIGHLYDYEPLAPALFAKRFRVEPMQDGAVTGVIEKICAANGIELEESPVDAGEPETPLARQILRQAKGDRPKQAVHLPYLQIYLHYLYEDAMRRHGRPFFSREGLRAVGRLGNVLRRFLETKLNDAQVYLSRHGAPDDLAQRLLNEFATDEGTRLARRRTTLAQSLGVEEPLLRIALNYFTDTAKLLRPDENEVDRYEPLHDEIARQIHELRSAEDREFRTFTRHLHLAWERWEKDGRPNDRLLGERDLSKADIYRQRLKRRGEYERGWGEFIALSHAHAKRRRRWQRRYVILVTVIAIIALAASGVALWKNEQLRQETNRAEQNENRAKQNERDAVRALAEAEENLKLYKREEFSRYLLDAEVYINSSDYGYAAWALDTAQRIQRRYFPDSLHWQDQIISLQGKILGQ